MHTVPELAKHFRVSHEVVRSWITSGLLPAVNVAPVGSKRHHYRISQESLSQFEASRSSGKPKPTRMVQSVKEWV
jgi:hypothetical protein